MSKVIRNVFKIDTLCLTECNDGFWLYDSVVEMNLSMKAKTEQDAFIQTILYYQKRFIEIKNDYKSLSEKVDNFISQFIEEEEN